MQNELPFPSSYWVLPGRFLAGHYPGDPDTKEAEHKLRGLLRMGIRHVINLMEEDEKNRYGSPFVPYQVRLAALGREMDLKVTCKRFPIRDLRIPTPEEMRAILDDIDGVIQRERPLYVHCLGGKGRTGTVVGCYLARNGIATGQDALDMVERLRRHVPDAYYPSPETQIQCNMVRGWKKGE